MKTYLNHAKGFIYVELIIGMALTVLLMGAAFDLFAVSLAAWKAGSVKVEVQETARVALDAMVREIRYDALQIANPADNRESNVLAIQVEAEDNPARRNTITFYRDAANVLYRRLDKWDGSATAFPITEKTVTALAFTVTHPRLVEISLTVTKTGFPPVTLESAVAALNAR
jgi:type II secretory pathway pseudopilin PulG